jgi:hypothetical protein
VLALFDPARDAWRSVTTEYTYAYTQVASAGRVALVLADKIPDLDDTPRMFVYRPAS